MEGETMTQPSLSRKRPDQLEFALAVLGRPKLEYKDRAPLRPVLASRAVARDEITLSGGRLLLGLAVSVSLASLFIWEFIRHWLFAP
jgi:hypothetical protein